MFKHLFCILCFFRNLFITCKFFTSKTYLTSTFHLSTVSPADSCPCDVSPSSVWVVWNHIPWFSTVSFSRMFWWLRQSLPAVQETWVRSLGQEDPLEEEMETHSSILSWKTLWTEEPGRLQSMGLQRIGHDWVTKTSTATNLANIMTEWTWIASPLLSPDQAISG